MSGESSMASVRVGPAATIVSEFRRLRLMSRDEFQHWFFKLHGDNTDSSIDNRGHISKRHLDSIPRSSKGHPPGVFKTRLADIMYEAYHVHRAIELCFFANLTHRETRQIVVHHLGLNPTIFEVVWKALRRQNKAAFAAYEAQLRRSEELDDATSPLRTAPTCLP